MTSLTATDDCAGCHKPLPKSEYMRCSACESAFDLECINLSTQRFYSFYKLDKKRRDNWKCPECVNKKPKSGNLNTPVRPISSPENSNNANVTLRVKSMPKEVCKSDSDKPEIAICLEDDAPLDPAVEIRKFWKEMQAIRTEMSMFRSAISDLTAAVKLQNSRLDNLEGRVDSIETRIGDTDCSALTRLEETIASLKFEIEERDQEVLGNDVEIANYPEIKDENPTHIILTVAKKLGVGIDERDVVSAQRVGAPRPAGDRNGAPARPRPLAVRLARRAQRDQLLQAARVRRRLTTDDMNLSQTPPSSRPFYINERLTRRNRQLFQKTREIANRLSWKYVWTRDGKVFARQENGKTRHRLRSEADFVRVFGAKAVSDANANCE